MQLRYSSVVLTTLEVAVFFFFALEEEISFDSSPQVFAINDLGRCPAGVKTFTLREG